MTETRSLETLDDKVAAVERAYEFMIAYAAQGRTREEEPGAVSGIRGRLTEAHAALAGLAMIKREDIGASAGAEFDGFLDVLRGDARKAQAMIGLVLSHPSIGSQLIDNLNASIHLRALLTDLFVIGEARKTSRA